MGHSLEALWHVGVGFNIFLLAFIYIFIIHSMESIVRKGMDGADVEPEGTRICLVSFICSSYIVKCMFNNLFLCSVSQLQQEQDFWI